MFTMLFKCYFNNQTEFECYLSGNKWDTCTYKAHNSLLYKHTCAMFMIILITSTGKNSVLSNISL